MMLQPFFLSKVIKDVAVIEATEYRTDSSSYYQFNGLHLKNNKGEITITTFIECCTLQQVEEWLQKKCQKGLPVLLNINTDRIIHKLVDMPTVDDDRLIKDLLPGGDPSTFYVHRMHYENSTVISIIRKATIHEVLKLLGFSNSIIDIYLGAFFVAHLYSHLQESHKAEFHFENYYIRFSDNGIVDFKVGAYLPSNEKQHLTIGSDLISSKLIASYAAGVRFLANPTVCHAKSIGNINQIHQEYQFKKLARLLTIYSVSIILCVLIVCNFIQAFYKPRNELLRQKIISSKAQQEKELYDRRVNWKRYNSLKNNGVCDSSCLSYYCDQITCIQPQSVYISRLDVCPANSRSLSEDIAFSANRINIEGNCFSGSELTNWINDLKKYKWIKNLAIRDYKESDNDMATFSLEIIKDTL